MTSSESSQRSAASPAVEAQLTVSNHGTETAALLTGRTRALYAAQLQRFRAWCSAQGHNALPASPEVVVAFLRARAQEGRRRGTLEQALIAIGHAHRAAGHPSPRDHALVREAWRHLCRTPASSPAERKPLLIAHLRAMVGALPQTLGGARDRALLLLGFATALRRAELVALELGSLTFTPRGLTVARRTLSNIGQPGTRELVVPYGRGALTCPVRVTQAWLERAGLSEGPLFRSVSRHGKLGRGLGGQDVTRIVKRAAHAVGLDMRAFTSHSLRAGLVTQAAMAGKSAHTIMELTGHRSILSVHRYMQGVSRPGGNAARGLL